MNYELTAILITVVTQALYMAYKMGRFEQKLDILDEKQQKHNNLIERMAKAEASLDAFHERMDKVTGGQL